jgi:serine/threonine protein kinase
MSAPTLHVVVGPDKDRVFTLKAEPVMLGRHQDCLYKLNDMRVSRNHCQIEWTGSEVVVTDNGSVGGTLVNGAAITSPTVLRNGDTVQVGETILRVNTGGTLSAHTTMPPGGGVRPAAEYDERATDELAELSGRTFMRYQLGEVLGKGTTSMVFRATNTDDGSKLALKVMQPAFSADEDEVHRFVRAMRATMAFNHPNIVRTYAAGKNGPYCWVALELVEGESLTDVIRRIGSAGMLDWKHAFKVGLHVARALGYAHAQGVIHRDITPANVLIEMTTKTAKLADLMLAKALEGALAKQITRPGELVGDVNYMSPERAGGGGAVDARSDLFSLGATCYTLLTGKPPFAGGSLVETLTKIRTAEPLKPSTFQLGIQSQFEFAVMKLLSKKPDDRYQTADELVKELERIGKFNGVPIT